MNAINVIENEDINDDKSAQILNDTDEEELLDILEEDDNINDYNSVLCSLLEDNDKKINCY